MVTRDMTVFPDVNRDVLAEDLRKALASVRPSKQESARHEQRVRTLKNCCGLLCMVTLPWDYTTVVPWLSFSMYLYINWLMLGHHIIHGAYNDRYPGTSYASGFSRVYQWMDWILPAAWRIEHNQQHHYFLNEDQDPDNVENNFRDFRKLPVVFGLMFSVIPSMLCWKWAYYASNTYSFLLDRQNNRPIQDPTAAPMIIIPAFFAKHRLAESLSFLFSVVGPYLACLLCIPGLYHVVFGACYRTVLTNLILGEIFTNIHSFVTVAPNHAGSDMYTYHSSCQANSGEFYLRQILSSANFTTSGFISNVLQGYLNFQIEHHLFPKESMLCLVRLQPKVRIICQTHGIPYVCESVFRRLYKTISIMLGLSTSRMYEIPEPSDTPDGRSGLALTTDVFPDEGTLLVMQKQINAIQSDQPRWWISSAYLVWDLLLCCGCFTFFHSIDGYLPMVIHIPLYAVTMGTVVMSLWVLAHEAGHGAFSSHRVLNDLVGFVLHTSLLVPYFPWKYTHAKHHKYTNDLVLGETHVPMTREEFEGSVMWMASRYFPSCVGVLTRLVIGWPAYLLFGATSGRTEFDDHSKPLHFWSSFGSHFNPLSRMLPRTKIFQSIISVLGVLLFALSLVRTYGILSVLYWYVGPYIVVHMWVVMYTVLQHTDETIPHTGGVRTSTSFLKGALQTIDRDYGLFGSLHHHIGTHHVAHHINHQIPFYDAGTYTRKLRPILGHYYRSSNEPILSALIRVSQTCMFVNSLEGTQFYRSLNPHT